MSGLEGYKQMMTTEGFERHARVYGVYFGLMLLAKVVTMRMGVLVLATPLFFLGGVLGMFVSFADQLIYVYFTRPQDDLSIQVKNLVDEKRYRDAVGLLAQRRHEQSKLAMNNVLFLGVWVALAIFLVSSSTSAFAKGLVMGIGLDLVYGIFRDWSNQDYLKKRLFWPVKREISGDELKAVVIAFVGFFGLTSLMVV